VRKRLRQKKMPPLMKPMRLSFDEKRLSMKKTMLASNTMPLLVQEKPPSHSKKTLLVDKKPLSQDKETLRLKSSRRCLMTKRKRETSKPP
jgi:hypothetical protein